MPQIRAFGMVVGIRSPRKEASALLVRAESGFAYAKALRLAGEYEDAGLAWNQAAALVDEADLAEQDSRRFFVRRDTWTAPAPDAGAC